MGPLQRAAEFLAPEKVNLHDVVVLGLVLAGGSLVVVLLTFFPTMGKINIHMLTS